MGGVFELTYCDLRCKEIVNAVDGKKLGRILDLVFTLSGEICGIVAPYGRKGFFSRAQEIFIPWKCIKKIGEDIILVETMDSPRDGRKERKHKESHRFGHSDLSEQYREYYHDNDCEPYDKKHGDRHEGHYEHAKHGKDDCHPKRSDRHEGHYEYSKKHGKDDCDLKHGGEDDFFNGHKERHSGAPHHDKRGNDHCRPDCDRRCEKCMLFDCIHRWRAGEGIFVDNKEYN